VFSAVPNRKIGEEMFGACSCLTNARPVGYCLPRAKFNIILPMAEWLFGRLDRRNGLSKKEHILIGRSRE
jgi:hypothetical protein